MSDEEGYGYVDSESGMWVHSGRGLTYLLTYLLTYSLTYLLSGFGGVEVACWPLVLKFAGSNPAEAVAFFRAKKSSARLPSEGK